jgi:NAD(P)-dependent dehydrogenase (short-subunit alcohol dehydrogenase family)
MHAMTTLDTKSIVIFGGSSGIGYAVAEACLLSRASLVIIVSSNAERVAVAVQRLEAVRLGMGKVHGEVIDATDLAALKEFVTRIGEVDHIVWTSGDQLKLGFPSVDLESLKSAFFFLFLID